MSLNNESVKTIEEAIIEEDRLIGNFFLLLFYSNPHSQYTRLIIDGGELKTNKSYDKFKKLIDDIVPWATRKVSICLLEYGKWWLIDKHKTRILEIHPSVEVEKLTIKQIYDDVHTETEDNIEKYKRQAMAEYTNRLLSPWTQKQTTKIQNEQMRRYGFIDYRRRLQ